VLKPLALLMNSTVLSAAHNIPDNIRTCFNKVQHHLFDLGGELCIPGHTALDESYITYLENTLDNFNDNLPNLKEFILPAGGKATSICHLARTVCRRAERRVVTLAKNETVSPSSISYLNRLSDLLFVIARVLARNENGSEVLWQPYQDKK